MRAEDAVQVVGVAQVLVIGGGAADRVVVHGADPQPAVPLVAAQPVGDGTELVFPEPAVVLLVRLGHGGVQSGHDDFAVGDLDQRPFRADSEANHGIGAVEPPEQGVEEVPLRPVRWEGSLVGRFALQKVGVAKLAVDVVVAGYDRELVPVEFQALRQRDEEVVRLVELALRAALGQVAGDHDEIRSQAVDVGTVSQIVVQPPEQGRAGAVRLGQPGIAAHVVRPELGVGDVQHRDRADRSGETRLPIRSRECGSCGRAGERRGDGGLRPTRDGAGDPRQQRVGGGRLVVAE